ncbi:hypothetical protein Ddc_13444 [Ditylenchus destructor]|nr:hypothetical protein Ddc_13444 [Ditylenchus destructor]
MTVLSTPENVSSKPQLRFSLNFAALAKQEQNRFAERLLNLPGKGWIKYDLTKKNEELLCILVGFLYGPPPQSESSSAGSTSTEPSTSSTSSLRQNANSYCKLYELYSKEQREQVEIVYKAIEKRGKSKSIDVMEILLYTVLEDGTVQPRQVFKLRFPEKLVMENTFKRTGSGKYEINYLCWEARFYNSWNHFLKTNHLPVCYYAYPRDGFYPTGFSVQVDFGYSPACRFLKKCIPYANGTIIVVSGLSTIATLTMIAVPGLAPLAIGTFGTFGTIVMATGMCTNGYLIVRQMADMFYDRHGKPRTWRDWLSLFSGIVGITTSIGSSYLTQHIVSQVCQANAKSISLNTRGFFYFCAGSRFAVSLFSLCVKLSDFCRSLFGRFVSGKKMSLWSLLDVGSICVSFFFMAYTVINFQTVPGLIESVTTERFQSVLSIQGANVQEALKSLRDELSQLSHDLEALCDKINNVVNITMYSPEVMAMYAEHFGPNSKNGSVTIDLDNMHFHKYVRETSKYNIIDHNYTVNLSGYGYFEHTGVPDTDAENRDFAITTERFQSVLSIQGANVQEALKSLRDELSQWSHDLEDFCAKINNVVKIMMNTPRVAAMYVEHFGPNSENGSVTIDLENMLFYKCVTETSRRGIFDHIYTVSLSGNGYYKHTVVRDTGAEYTGWFLRALCAGFTALVATGGNPFAAAGAVAAVAVEYFAHDNDLPMLEKFCGDAISGATRIRFDENGLCSPEKYAIENSFSIYGRQNNQIHIGNSSLNEYVPFTMQNDIPSTLYQQDPVHINYDNGPSQYDFSRLSFKPTLHMGGINNYNNGITQYDWDWHSGNDAFAMDNQTVNIYDSHYESFLEPTSFGRGNDIPSTSYPLQENFQIKGPIVKTYDDTTQFELRQMADGPLTYARGINNGITQYDWDWHSGYDTFAMDNQTVNIYDSHYESFLEAPSFGRGNDIPSTIAKNYFGYGNPHDELNLMNLGTGSGSECFKDDSSLQPFVSKFWDGANFRPFAASSGADYFLRDYQLLRAYVTLKPKEPLVICGKTSFDVGVKHQRWFSIDKHDFKGIKNFTHVHFGPPGGKWFDGNSHHKIPNTVYNAWKTTAYISKCYPAVKYTLGGWAVASDVYDLVEAYKESHFWSTTGKMIISWTGAGLGAVVGEVGGPAGSICGACYGKYLGDKLANRIFKE